MEEYLKKAIDGGEALLFNSENKEKNLEFIRKKLNFLSEVFGEEWKERRVEEWYNLYNEKEVIFKGDISMDFMKWLPSVMVDAYKKMISDFKEEIYKTKKDLGIPVNIETNYTTPDTNCGTTYNPEPPPIVKIIN